MSNNQRKWSEEEIEYLKKNATKKSIKDIAKKLNRTENSIKNKYQHLKLKSSNKIWTEYELNYIQDNWGKKTYEEMSKKLKRSAGAIKEKGARLGLGYRFHSNPNLITFSKLLEAFNFYSGYKYWEELFVRNNFPMEYMHTDNNIYKMININKFWKWAENNKKILNFSKMQKNILGKEPDWVDIKRKADLNTPSKVSHNRLWTVQEDSLLISKVKSNKYTYADLSKEFNRTQCAIKRRLRDLQIPYRPVPLNNMIKWTAEENRKMIEMHEMGFTNYAIALKLNKTELSISDRIKLHYEGKLERKPIKYWTEEDTKYLIDNWHSKYIDDIAEDLGRSYYSIKQKAYNLKLGNNPLGKYDKNKNKEVA